MVAVKGIVRKCLVTDSTVPDPFHPVHTLLKNKKAFKLREYLEGYFVFSSVLFKSRLMTGSGSCSDTCFYPFNH